MNSLSAPRHNFRIQLVGDRALTVEEPSSRTEDLKLFATFWLGGLVFFGTFLA